MAMIERRYIFQTIIFGVYVSFPGFNPANALVQSDFKGLKFALFFQSVIQFVYRFFSPSQTSATQ